MIKDHYRVLGVMSGTSLDGVDLAEVFFTKSEATGWSYKFGICETFSYPGKWKSVLGEAITYPGDKIRVLNAEYTRYLGRLIRNFIKDHNLKGIDAVCSHGHTILHQPENGITLQIGNLPEIATLAEATVICDFRVQDVAMGGQGAPLVPIGDRLLFGQYDYCLNLGGFANISTEVSENGAYHRMAYDVCPVNVVLNHYARQLGREFDRGGELAASGNRDDGLFSELNDLVFYKRSAPKSLGMEWVRENIFPLLDDKGLPVQDLIRTFTDHVGYQLILQFRSGSSILVTGGGAYNDYLIRLLRQGLGQEVYVPDAKLLEYKEALVFGLLGVLRLRNEINCLASVTGAHRDHSSGIIFLHNS